MKGDFSRITGSKANRKHFNAVLKQQGRVQLDSDWNELNSIIAHQRKARTIDTIGQNGAPIHNSGFQILHPGSGLDNDLLITTGRFYAGGLLSETTPSSKLTILNIENNTLKVDDIEIDGEALKANQWVQIYTDENPDGFIRQINDPEDGEIEIQGDTIPDSSANSNPYLKRLLLYSDQQDLPNQQIRFTGTNQTRLIYLDIWERHMTSIEDSDLREVALGGPDTDSRSKIIAQVKVLEGDLGDVTCQDEIPAWENHIKEPDGRLTTIQAQVDESDGPCGLGESGGYNGLENRLYRVEIHEEDTAGTYYFKWSRDNAAQAYLIEKFEAGDKVRIASTGKDDILKIKGGDVIEITNDEIELSGGVGEIRKVQDPDTDNILVLDTNITALDLDTRPKVRRWDTSHHRLEALTEIVSDETCKLEDGISIKFSGNNFKSGDYWVFSARALTGEIEILDEEPPLGVKHHYCKLALVTDVGSGDVEIEDCRPEFLPLTELPGKGGCCTVTVGEDGDFQDIQLAIDSLDEGPGTVCIDPGVYFIEEPINIKGSDITVKGCGGTPFIINSRQNAINSPDNGVVFLVEDSRDIELHDLGCFSLAAGKVVQVNNSRFFSLHDCMLIGAGKSEEGIVTCKGPIDTSIYDNLILGIIGIHFLESHFKVRIENNIVFALKSAFFQDGGTIMGFDMVDNLMMGFGLALLSHPLFPKGLFEAAEESNIYKEADLEEAKKARNLGTDFTSIFTGEVDKIKIGSLQDLLRSVAITAETSFGEWHHGELVPTTGPVADLSGFLMDANITDNILVGMEGISSATGAQVAECSIDSNLLFTQRIGIGFEQFNGVIIENNLVTAGEAAIKCSGSLAHNLSIVNNRLLSNTIGVEFDPTEKQTVLNFQVNNNLIVAKQLGISLMNGAILLEDFTVIDNTIKDYTEYGIFIGVFDEIQDVSADNVNYQRVIQRNSISGTGSGIHLNVSDSRILDNEINLRHVSEPTKFRGIWLLASNGTIASNTIHGELNLREKRYSGGGIHLSVQKEYTSTEYHQIDIRCNKILGGVNDGIEIASSINGLVIEENQIAGMGLNGIAVQDLKYDVNSLRIKGNHIHNCHQLAAEENIPYAGIVLGSTQKTQVVGNVIKDNVSLQWKDAYVGAFYAERMEEISISNNQFINNGPEKVHFEGGAAINIQYGLNPYGNSDIQITNNIVKVNNLSMILFLGNRDGQEVLDRKVIITGNHFESFRESPCVILVIKQSIFSNNYVLCAPKLSTVAFPNFSKHVMANGNVVSGPIMGDNINQVNTLQF